MQMNFLVSCVTLLQIFDLVSCVTLLQIFLVFKIIVFFSAIGKAQISSSLLLPMELVLLHSLCSSNWKC
jgi:hypothetical protein